MKKRTTTAKRPAATLLLLDAIELSGGDEPRAPEEFRILRRGTNETRKGRLVFDEAAAAAVLSDFEVGGVDLPIDLDHAMADPTAPRAERKAYGWFQPDVRDGELWAAKVRWTEEGRQAVESREWRYTSLWGELDPIQIDKRPALRLKRLLNLGLVNRPATNGTVPLVANEGHDTNTEIPMADQAEKSALVVALGARDEAEVITKYTQHTAILSDAKTALGVETFGDIGAAVRALKVKGERYDAQTKELETLKTQQLTDKREALIVKLSEEGKLPPTLVEWARTQTIESLQVFGANAPAAKPPVQTAAVELSEDTPSPDVARMLELAKLTVEDFKKAKKAGVV